MSAANLITELRSFADPQEVELFGVLCSDNKVQTALLARNLAMLSRVFHVSVAGYEDMLKDRYEVFFRNYGGKFEIRQAKVGLLEIRDDVLGTIGASIVARLMSRDANGRSSTYLGGKRSKSTLLEMAEAVDREGLLRAVSQLPSQYPKATDVCFKINSLLQEGGMLGAALPSEDMPKSVVDKWDAFLSRVVSLFSFLRTSPGKIFVRDVRPSQQTVTIAEYFKSMGTIKLAEVSFKPSDGPTFSDAERAALSLAADSYDLVVGEDGGELMVAASRDVFSYIGDEFLAPPELPVWTEDWSQAEGTSEGPCRSEACKECH